MNRILLLVEGEPSLSDTFTVGLGSTLILPAVGDVSLVGVLRSELQDYLARRLGQNLRDAVVRARAYVRLAERESGPIPRPAGFSWPWGDALRIIDDLAPDVRVINLETSITRSCRFAPGKAVHYRMSPGNVHRAATNL